MTIGFIGLGKMGQRMVKKLLIGGHDVIVWNRSESRVLSLQEEIAGELYASHLHKADTVRHMVNMLASGQKVIWLMLPAGEVTRTHVSMLADMLQKGDILIDGGNTQISESEAHAMLCDDKGIEYLGIGVSGGIRAFSQGYPLMAGGSKRAYQGIVPVLDSLAFPNGGHVYVGERAAGHFVKMIHNGIEYGMMQSIAEGMAVLEKSSYEIDIPSVVRLFQKNTIVSGFLMECLKEAYQQDPSLSRWNGPVSQSGEAQWMIEHAVDQGLDIPVIRAALDYRIATQKHTALQTGLMARVLNALRATFGGHRVER
jgi:6-phosphogluconate dehydrogenase